MKFGHLFRSFRTHRPHGLPFSNQATDHIDEVVWHPFGG
jgi:hypothetical protein